MPRTKRPVRKLEKSTDSANVLQKLDKIVQEEKDKIRVHAENRKLNVECEFKLLLGSISSTNLNKTIGQLKKDENLDKERQTRKYVRTGSHDDGYLTENSSQGSESKGATRFLAPPSVTRTVRARRSRSADTSRSRATPAPRSTRRLSRSVYRTPAYTKNLPPITPKLDPKTAMTILRQPRQGEMVLSMSGSPVMVPSCYALQSEEQANCNIMLTDGTMLALQPKQLRPSQDYIPFALMNNKVMQQLKTLQDNLSKITQLGERVMP